MIERVDRSADRLDSSGAVDVGHRGDARPPGVTDLDTDQHVRAVVVELEYLRGAFFQDARRQRSENLTEFYVDIDVIFHVSNTRISEDAAVAESPRAVLATVLEPADHRARRQPVDGVGDQRLVVAEPLIGEPAGVEQGMDLTLLVAAPAECVADGDDGARRIELEMALVGEADGLAIVARRGLDEDSLERPAPADEPVGDGIERDPSREA
jgi:hypothetical protein